jgi:hypothetical protein
VDTTVIVALITAGGVVIAALIAVLPHLLNREKRPGSPSPSAPRVFPDGPPASLAAERIQAEPVPKPTQPLAGASAWISGTSASAQRTPREMDLTLEGDELLLHVHQPGGSQTKMWVSRTALQAALDQRGRAGATADRLEVPARTARKEATVAFVFLERDEVEVQAGWWIWVRGQELKAAFEGFGLRVPW